MPRYFFDFKAGDVVTPDEEGTELLDVEKAHDEALGSLVDAICDFAKEGHCQQSFVVVVRDEYGPVLNLSAVFDSKILRTQ
jgi:hypothetical protein